MAAVNLINETGNRYGLLTVIRRDGMSVTEFKEWVRRVYARSVVVAGSGK
jgi:hypothetical protein